MQYRKLGLLVITCLITLSGCTSKYDASKDNIDRYKTTTIVNNNESKETTSGDGLSSKRLSYELTDNLKIDAEVEYTGTSNCDTYHAKVKEFDADIITNAFIQDMDKMKKVENPNGLELTGDDGSSLFIGEGRFSYTSSVAEQDILYLLQGAYYSELQYQKDRANADELVQEKVVQKAIKKVETV